jgi:hypothetical protein
VCQAGGTKEVEELSRRLDDKEIVFTFQIDEPCDQRILMRELSRVADRLKQVEAVLVLACGTGVQMVARFVEKPCLAGLDTFFAGAVVHSGKYFELCDACGGCLLNKTAGICPRTLCPKGIANGPCSEKIGEMCCVDEDEKCVWTKIAERMELAGINSDHVEAAPVDWAAHRAPRRIPVNEALSAARGKDHGKDS